ncbi:UNVERIFIED_CONTAM: hypothetical protein Sangu_0979100 [Sesamum angustifolium]|uniref:Uncharacterized protein n=1 Tax=Sesamum angustifolium TaxID=2727405 RepID=A0AAW2PG90_9LAMI
MDPVLESGALAFGWDALTEPGHISAVIVDHMLLLDPSQPVSASGIKFLGLPFLVTESISRCRPAGSACRPVYARVDLEVPVVGHKWSFGPVRLDPPALCCPVICVPQAALYSHGLTCRKGDSDASVVVEYSNRNVVHQESEIAVYHTVVNYVFQGKILIKLSIELMYNTFVV